MRKQFKFSNYSKQLYSYNWWSNYIGESYQVSLSPNTTVHKKDSEGLIRFYLHGHNICTVSSLDRWQLSSCGWESHTTKKRLNQLTPIKLWQKDYVWLYENENGCIEAFEDDIIIDHRSKREYTLCWKKLNTSLSVL